MYVHVYIHALLCIRAMKLRRLLRLPQLASAAHLALSHCECCLSGPDQWDVLISVTRMSEENETGWPTVLI